MSVDYNSVLIYGYKITAKEVERLKEDIGVDKFYELCEKYDNSEHYTLSTDSHYYNSDYYFGVTLGREIELDAIDSICWYEYETGAIDKEFECAFGSMTYADTHSPKMYHFIQEC